MFRKLIRIFSQKAIITIFSFLIQVALIVTGVMFFSAQYWWMNIVFEFFGICVCLYIVSRNINTAYKLSWCVFVLLAPAFGGLVYLFIGRQHIARRTRKRLKKASDTSQVLYNMTNAQLLDERKALNPTGSTCADLVLNGGSYPVYGNTQTQYFSLGDDFFPAMLKDIRAAKKFIFMEYFIIEHGQVWSEIESALIERAQAGVDVKLIYDDVGSMFTLPKKGIKRLIAGGVQVEAFNKITLSFDMRLNSRSHRKITVIDGDIAYTGGNNIADEYANKIERFGHWKDTHMRFCGDAVWSFTTMFLSFWSILRDTKLSYTHYLGQAGDQKALGYVQPVSSGPGRDDHLIESAFINLISTARRSVYITTPYLILDSEMQTALINAAQAGIDVRIIIPHVPDKKIVYFTTKSFAAALVNAGVKIYRYTPGFIHAKMLIVDDERAFIGTCNMDYRSFYLHYEDGAILYNTSSIADMKADFLDTMEKCKQFDTEQANNVTIPTKIMRSILRLLAPMM